MALTIHGYRLPKTDVKNLLQLKGILNVRPYIPSVFVKPQFVHRYPVYLESEEYIYVPKHYGIETYGEPKVSYRDVPKTEDKYWEFSGTIRAAQEPVVNSFLLPSPRDGILSLQTGGGKTVCALYIASQIKLPTLVLVHSGFLKDQWVERIQSFLPKARVGTVQGEVLDIQDKDIVVGMVQTISMKEFPPKTFSGFGLVIVDECHHIASEAFVQAIPKLTSKHMLGLSATPERKDKLMYVINWCLGPMLYKSDSAEKVDSGVKVEVLEFETDDAEFNTVIKNQSGVMFTSLMVNKLTEFEPRNKMIVELLKDLYEDTTRQILVLSDRVEHTKKLFELLPPDIQKHTGILARGMKPAVRTEFCESKRILISTYQLVKEGYDVESLNTLVMATPRPDIEQIVGRILRVEKAKRTVAPLVIDIVDSTFRRQFQERLRLYRDRCYETEKIKMD